MRKIGVCKNCKEEFKYDDSEHSGQFCSRDCFNEHSRKVSKKKLSFLNVDSEDLDSVSEYSWYFEKNGGTFYASASINGERIFLHRLIMKPKQGEHVDHINGNGLDNRKSNLRICTKQQNQFNRKVISKNNKSGYKGVSWSKDKAIWRATIMFNWKQIWLGYFYDPIKAARAYNEAAIKYFGKFARLNKI